MNILLKIWYWCTGQLELRESLKKLSEQKEIGAPALEQELARLERIERFEYNATISTKVSAWVSRAIEYKVNYYTVEPEIIKIEHEIRRIKQELKPIKQVLPKTDHIQKSVVTKKKGGLGRTAKT